MPHTIYLDDQRPPLSVDEVLLALYENHGDMSAAAQSLGRPRHSVKNLVDRTPTLQLYVEDVKGEIYDCAKNVIVTAVKSGDLGAAKLVVTTLGKDDGWSTRQEHTGKDGEKLTVVIEGMDSQL